MKGEPGQHKEYRNNTLEESKDEWILKTVGIRKHASCKINKLNKKTHCQCPSTQSPTNGLSEKQKTINTATNFY
jgi:hypothetical protein